MHINALKFKLFKQTCWYQPKFAGAPDPRGSAILIDARELKFK